MGAAILERARAVAAAERRFQERVAAIRTIKELSIDEPQPPLRHGEVMARVKLAVLNMPDVFNLRELVRSVRERDAIGSRMSAKAISVAVKRLVGQFVDVCETGRGKRGTRYRRTVSAGSPIPHLSGAVTAPPELVS